MLGAPSAGRAAFTGRKFVRSQPAATSQSGQFAVFTAAPPTNVAFNGSDLKIYNFPNPFDLTEKTLTLRDGGALGTSLTTDGTIIRYGLPPAKSGHIQIVIYNLAGEKVKTIDEGHRDGGWVYYTPWDGKNDNGSPVASGVYFGVFKVNEEKEYVFKMAVLK